MAQTKVSPELHNRPTHVKLDISDKIIRGFTYVMRRGCIRGGLRLRAAEGTRITASELRSSALSARGQFGRRGEKRRAVPEGGRVI